MPVIYKWNSSNFITMERLFSDCSSLILAPDISEWKAYNTTNMKFMFEKCSSLYSIPDMSLAFGNKNTMNYLFNSEIYNLKNINDKIAKSFEKYKEKNKLDKNFVISPLYELSKTPYKTDKKVEKIKIFGETFVKNNKDKCIIIYKNNIFPLSEYFPIKLLDTINEDGLEIVLREFVEINDKNFMFHNYTLLEGFPKFKDHKEFLQYLLKDETYIYFEDSKTYKRIYLDGNENNIEKEMIIEKGKDPYSIIGCASLSLSFLSDKGRLYIPCPNSMSFTFSHCSSLVSLPDISYWNMNNVYTISSLFDGCLSLSILPDLSKWEPITCELMSSVFRGCSSLKALPDISHWVTEKTQDIPEIFKGCSSLVSLPDISK